MRFVILAVVAALLGFSVLALVPVLQDVLTPKACTMQQIPFTSRWALPDAAP